MRVLVLGGGGQVANALAESAPAGWIVSVVARRDLDVTDGVKLEAAARDFRADWLLNGAAYTAVDKAESEPAQAHAVNGAAVGAMARAARACGGRLLHVSTDFVFDGSANRAYGTDAVANPLSVYGASKLEGERQALSSDSNAIVLRTAWVYAAAGRNFVLTMLRLMRERSEVRVVADQIGTPTWATGIAGCIWSLVAAGAAGGIYHWTDLGVASWYDFAVAIQEEALALGLLPRAVPVIPIATADYPTPARRPAFSLLDTTSTRSAVAAPAVHWRQNLRTMLHELRAQ